MFRGVSVNEFELKILDFIQEHLKCGFLDWFMPLITKLGDAGIFWIIVAVVLLIFKKTRKTGAMVGVALLLGLLIGNVTLKPLIERLRRYDFYEQLTGGSFSLLIDAEKDFSFPSGHTLASFEAATILLINDKRLGIPAVILASVIAFSRLYLYVHYPTDILGGIVLGVLIAFVACFIVNKVVKVYTARRLAK